MKRSLRHKASLEPKEYVDVGAQVSGQIKSLKVAIGDTVKSGDLLAELDPRIYESKVEADQAQINSLKAQVAEQSAQVRLAQQQFNRNKSLFDEKAVSRDVLDTATASIKAATAKLNSLKAQLDQIQSTLKGDQANLSFTKIYAPMDGTVTTQPVREGQTVNAVQQAPTLMQVANLSVMTVRAQVAEADVPNVQPDMDVSFTTLGSDRKWNAKVRQVLPSPQTVNDVVLYDVLVDVDNPDNALMTGMSTQMFFAEANAKDVLLIPMSALGVQDKNDPKQYKVRVLPNDNTSGKPQEKTVTVGINDRVNSEITGLNEGEHVVLNVAPDTGKKPGASGGMRGPRI